MKDKTKKREEKKYLNADREDYRLDANLKPRKKVLKKYEQREYVKLVRLIEKALLVAGDD